MTRQKTCSVVRAAGFTVLALWASTRSTEAMCVEVALRFREGQAAPAVVDSLKQEASWLWAPYGVRIEWPSADSTPACARPQISFDVLMDGQRSRRRGFRVVLGTALLTRSSIRRASIYIHYGAAEQLLDTLSAGQVFQLLGRATAAHDDFGRALGRILAHEIGHVILAAGKHQPKGLMRATFVAEDLIRPDRWSFTLSEAEVARLRERELTFASQASASAR